VRDNFLILVGPSGFEPLTPVLSGLCSNQLSYGPASLFEKKAKPRDSIV
jgi:hypothetical protein